MDSSLPKEVKELLSSSNENNFSKLLADGGDISDLPPEVSQVINSTPTDFGIQEQKSGGSDLPPEVSQIIGNDYKQQKYGSLGQQGITALEGAGKGIAGPLAPFAESMAGVKPEDILGREEENPVASTVGEVAGLVAPAVLTGGESLAARATLGGLSEAGGKLAAKQLAKLFPAAADTLAAKVGTSAAKLAVENMIITGSDEASKLILNDPNTSAETAITTTGLAGLIGAGLAGTLGAVPPLWKKAVGNKTSQLLEDFKGRINEHISNPDPVEAFTNELSNHYKSTTSMADEVYGPAGLKAQDVEKAIPQMSAKIAEQVSNLSDKMDRTLTKMAEDPYNYPERLRNLLYKDIKNFKDRVSVPDATPADMFNAAQDLKQTMQGYSKFSRMVQPHAEDYGFVKIAKDLGYDLRTSLEDPSVWGKAAERQLKINQAFTSYLPALKDFEKKFTTAVGEERVIDPAKVNTYLNQIGKPNAEIKQQMLQNFLDQSEKYRKVIADTHTNLGIESPLESAPLNNVKATLGEKTLGAKLADAFIKQGLDKGLGTAAGGALGATVGHATHVPGAAVVGAYLGSHTLGPMFNSILPGITKSLLEKPHSAEGFKAAADYIAQVHKGTNILNKAAKNIFKEGSSVLADHLHPTERERNKLDNSLKTLQTNPTKLLGGINQVQKYLPDNATSMDSTVANVTNYLNSIRAPQERSAPLDSTPVLSPVQKADYTNALNLAQQPLLLFDKLKNGMLTAKDLQHVSAMYPALYGQMQQKLADEMIVAISKGEEIPYKTKIGISMFMAQPMDSTMQPAAIMNIQNVQHARIQQQQQTQAPKKSSGVKSSPALQKLPGLYATPAQAKEQHKGKY